jgi:pyruvate formate lyase activating enzyme
MPGSIDKMEDITLTRRVLSITRMTIHNGPGIRTLVLFKGCPLRCQWCSTPESQSAEPELALHASRCILCGRCVPLCPVGAIDLSGQTLRVERSLCTGCGECTEVCPSEALVMLGRMTTTRDLCQELMKDKSFFKHSGGGVTLSGGEPLLDTDYVFDLSVKLKREGISTGIDTCGCVPLRNIERVLPYVDFFLWDIKHMDPHRHKELTGVSNETVLENLKAVSRLRVPIYIRMPVIPGHNDSGENIRVACEFILSLPTVVEIDLLPVHHLGQARYESLNRVYPISGLPLIADPVLEEFKRLVESYGLKTCIVR